MIIEKELSYHKRLVISPDRINELDSLLRKYCEPIKYEATTRNGTTLIFDNKNELLEYDNFTNGKITNLDIMCLSKDCKESIVIDFVPKASLNNATATCKYKLNDKDKESLFVSAWNSLLSKSTEFQISYMICRIATYVLILSLCVFLPIQLFNTQLRDLSFLFVSFILVCGFIKLLFNKNSIWDKLFPPAVFPWGEEEQKYSKLVGLRSNIFWAIVIPTIMSIIIEVVSIVKTVG